MVSYIKTNEKRIKRFKNKIIEILPNEMDLPLLNDFLVALARTELLIVRHLVLQKIMSKKDAIRNLKNIRKQMIKLIKGIND